MSAGQYSAISGGAHERNNITVATAHDQTAWELQITGDREDFPRKLRFTGWLILTNNSLSYWARVMQITPSIGESVVILEETVCGPAPYRA